MKGNAKLSAGTLERIAVLFPLEERGEVSKILREECGNNLPFLQNQDEIGRERYRFAALKLSEGNREKLRQAVKLAKRDWCDLPVAAGFADRIAAQGSWTPNPNN